MSKQYVREIIRVFTILQHWHHFPEKWCKRAILVALTDHQGPSQDGKPENLWWWVIEAGSHMNSLFFDIPHSKRVTFKYIARELTGYRPPWY